MFVDVDGRSQAGQAAVFIVLDLGFLLTRLGPNVISGIVLLLTQVLQPRFGAK